MFFNFFEKIVVCSDIKFLMVYFILFYREPPFFLVQNFNVTFSFSFFKFSPMIYFLKKKKKLKIFDDRWNFLIEYFTKKQNTTWCWFHWLLLSEKRKCSNLNSKLNMSDHFPNFVDRLNGLCIFQLKSDIIWKVPYHEKVTCTLIYVSPFFIE